MVCLVLVLFSLFGLGGSSTTRSNSVSGKVIDATGKAVPGVEILLMLVNKSGVFPSATSDKYGRFKFERIAFPEINLTDERLELTVTKPVGYLMPPSIFILGFPTGGSSPKFRLGASQHLKNQTIQFGPPGGRLVIRLVDEKGGRIDGKFKTRKKGHPPPINLPINYYNYPPLDVIMPVGEYELEFYTMKDEFIRTVQVTVEAAKVTEKTITISAAGKRK